MYYAMHNILFLTIYFCGIEILKNKKMKNLITIIASMLIIVGVNGQVQRLDGPRFGVTVLTPGLLADIINDDRELDSEDPVDYTQKQAILTQFGWQWETRLVEGGDYVGLIEWIVLAGGLDKGTVVPSISGLVGMRRANGFEIAVGPTASFTGIGMAFAVGHTYKAGDLNIPINIAWVPSRTNHLLGDPSDGEKLDSGNGVSVMIGFNFGRKK